MTDQTFEMIFESIDEIPAGTFNESMVVDYLCESFLIDKQSINKNFSIENQIIQIAESLEKLNEWSFQGWIRSLYSKVVKAFRMAAQKNTDVDLRGIRLGVLLDGGELGAIPDEVLNSDVDTLVNSSIDHIQKSLVRQFGIQNTLGKLDRIDINKSESKPGSKMPSFIKNTLKANGFMADKIPQIGDASVWSIDDSPIRNKGNIIPKNLIDALAPLKSTLRKEFTELKSEAGKEKTKSIAMGLKNNEDVSKLRANVAVAS